MADSGNAINEISEANNIGTVTVNVGGTLTQADLVITSADITLNPSRPHAGDTVTISANVRNIGAEAANNFTVEIFDGQPEAGGTLIAGQTISLVAGGSQVVSTNWPIPAGIHDIVVVLDRTNQIAETNESNNRASVRVMTEMVDISLSATDLVFTPSHPVNGDSVVLSITAHNTGIKNTGAFNLALYDGDPAAGGTLLQTFPISNITGDGSAAVSYVFIAIPWTYRFYAIADVENVVTELYEDNNTAIRSLKIKAPGEVLGPDLIPTKFDLTFTTTDPQTLAISGNAQVTFQNKGDDKITTSFNVLIFEDMDGDGKYTSGVDNLLSTATNTFTIRPEGAGLVNLPLSGTVQFLHSPLYASIDSGDSILEQDETNNLLVSCKDCQVVPTNPIQPVLKWKWQNGGSIGMVTTPPVIAPLIDTNGDGKIDEKDDPYLVFLTYYGWYSDALHAVNGRTGVELFTINSVMNSTSPSNIAFYSDAHIAVGDINNDGIPEIVIPKYTNGNGSGLLAFKNDGTLLWDNTNTVTAWNQAQSWPPRYFANIHSSSSLSIADLDGDGKPEIIAGGTAVNGDGTIKWSRPLQYVYQGQGWTTGTGTGMGQVCAATVVDLDLDGNQEVLAGNTAYNADGTIKWMNTSLQYDGFSIPVNFNNDPYPEVLYGNAYSPYNVRIYLLDHTGKILWGPVYLYDLEAAALYVRLDTFVIADFDGDGETEIGIKGYNYYFILDRSGNLKTISIPYDPAGTLAPYEGINASSPTVFDLNGDGRPEIISNSGYYFRIQDGKDGTLLYQEGFGGSGCISQNVIVSDVDNDGHADLVVFGGGGPLTTPQNGLSVYSARNNDWAPSRTIWNETFYHVTNVNDDGTIPQYEAPSWLLNNTYLTQASIGKKPNPYLTPNLTASYLRAEQAGPAINLAVRVGNGGATISGPTVTVTFYDSDPASGGTVIGTASTTRALNPGDYQDVIYSWTGGSLGLHHHYAVVDAANAISECRKDDNQASTDFTIQTSYADLKISPEDITLPAGPYTAGIPVTITTNVKNVGTLPASNIAVRLYDGNPSAGGTQIGNDQVIPGINAASSVPVIFMYDTTGRSGTNVLYIVVDPANTVIESSKTNNTAATTVTVQPPTLPDLAIAQSDIQVSPTTLHEGDTASITATIHNLGVAAGNIPVRMSVRSGEFGVGSEVYSETRTIYPILSPGQTATVTTTFDTTGLAGQQSIVVTIDPANSITESRKDNNSAFQPFFVQTAGLNASVTLDKTAYQADDIVTATITAADTTGSARSLTLGLYVQDSAGNRIATISSTNLISINPNSVATLSRTWNTGTTLSGQYTIIAELAESGQVISRKSAGFTILPDSRVNAVVTTDKISYNPNETAALTAVATSQSRNYVFENLSATLTISLNGSNGSNGPVFVDTKNVTTLMPGATFTFKDYWNTGTFASGTYPVTLTIRDSTNAIIATGTQNLTISTIVKPTAVLRGQISVSSQELLTGDTTTVSYTVTNVGNTDLQNITLTVLTVNVSDQTVYNTFTYPMTLAMGGAVSNTLTITTADYTAKDYLVVLRANIAGTEETLAGTYFRIEGAPSAPSLASPAMNADVETFTPTLSVNNASDPNDDKLTYEFEVYSDSGLTSQVTGSTGQGTAWTVAIDLTENQTYFWRCRAYDGKLYGDWMQAASFRVNTINDPPTAPTVSSPAVNGVVDTLLPVLGVNNASDPDSSSLTYNFDVALDPNFTQIVASKTGVFEGTGTTSWQVPTSLSENTTYFWRCQADDWLITGPWMTAASFFVNTANDAPTAPVIIAPLKDSTVAAFATDIVITNSTDPDSPVLTYLFEVDTVPTFDSPGIKRSGPSTGSGQATTTWHVTALQEDTQYYVRAKASDGQADSAWSNPVGFFVNVINEPPTTPTLANPSNGAGVTVFTPTLSIHNATDPDRDVLTYDFEVYADAAMNNIIAAESGVGSSELGVTSWTIPVMLTENRTYYWRARASDGTLASEWMPAASFMVNTANDAPGAPTLSSPVDGSSVATLNPTLSVTNAVDPDSTNLTYSFEVYSGTTLVTSVSNVPAGSSGITSITLSTALTDNTVYQWRARAYDGDRYGPWMAMASFTTHVQQTGISATIDFDPNTLNKTSTGNWVVVYIELPVGYNVADINVSSVRLNGTIPAEIWPYAVGDHDKDGITDLMVKFKRSDIINLLPDGDQVTVHVTGRVGATTFDGVDIIRVMK